MRRTILAAAAAAILVAGGDAPEARAAAPDWCRLYCEAVYAGCKTTVGRLDGEYCEAWYRGCKDGCRVSRD